MQKILLFGLLFLTTLLSAQKEASDPKAKTMLDKLRAKYEGYKTMQADFKLTSEMGKDKDVLSGKIYVKGAKYRVTSNKQEMVSDGATVWFYMKQNNEVQINNADNDSENTLSPTRLFKIYDEGDKLVFSIVGEGTENGKKVTFVEFKPTDKKADYHKIRVSIDKTTETLSRAIIFNKDSSKYTFDITNLTANPAIGDDKFTFDPSKYPGINTVDLRN